MSFVYKADPERGDEWAACFAQRAPDVPFRLWPDVGDPAQVRYLALWEPLPDLARMFPNLRVVFSAGAGVDQFDWSQLPGSIALVRMIEPGITETMVEYVSMAVLALHRDLVTYIAQQRQRRWRTLRAEPASKRRVGVMGAGVLGRAVLSRLAAFGFRRASWSRSRQTIEGVDCYAGPAELPAFVARTDILVYLLPLTDATRGP